MLIFRQYVQQALNGNKYLSGVLVGAQYSSTGVIGSVPVYSEDGSTLLGLVSTRIKVEYIANILADTVLSDKERLSNKDVSEIEVYLINPYGIVMSHSNQDSTWINNSLGTVTAAALEDIRSTKMLGADCPEGDENCDVNDKIAREPGAMPALQPLADELLANMATGISGYFQYCRASDLTKIANDLDCLGEWHTIGYAPVTNPVSTSGDSIFTVIVDIPDDVFLGEIKGFVKQAVYGALGLALLIIVVALIVARTMAKPIGHLSQAAKAVANDQPFEPEDIADVTALGDEVGNLARVFSGMVLALRARMAELRTIYEIGNKISGSVELADTLSEVISSLGNVINFDAAEICLYEMQDKKLSLYLTNDQVMDADETIEKPTYDLNQDYFPVLLEARHGLLVDDISAYQDYPLTAERSWHEVEPKSYLGVSLREQGQVVGTIEMVNRHTNGFNEDNLRILESIAIQAAVAIGNAREVKERERRLKNMDIVIDTQHIDQQVEAITGQAFFKALKKKVKK